MLIRPPELSDDTLAATLTRAWFVDLRSMEYLPVGFGSHHWRVEAGNGEWFVTVDDLTRRRRHRDEPTSDPLRRLTAALTTALSLGEAGLGFVVAPQPTRNGDVLETIGPRFAVALHRWVEGTPSDWGDRWSAAARSELLDLIARLHRVPSHVYSPAMVEDFAVPRRTELYEALADTDIPWGPGPYANRARRLVDDHRTAIVMAMERLDELSEAFAARRSRMVLTHGEPHPGNVITTAQGMVLVDWDSVLIAPPERDLWPYVADDPSVAGAYRDLSGAAFDDGMLELYRILWDLTDIAGFAWWFRAPHTANPDTRTAWEAFDRSIRRTLGG